MSKETFKERIDELENWEDLSLACKILIESIEKHRQVLKEIQDVDSLRELALKLRFIGKFNVERLFDED